MTHHGYSRGRVVYREGAGEPLPVAPQVAPQLDLVPSAEVRHRGPDYPFPVRSADDSSCTCTRRERGRAGQPVATCRPRSLDRAMLCMYC